MQHGKLKCRVTVTSQPMETKELLALQKCTVAEQLGSYRRHCKSHAASPAENRCQWLISLPPALSFKGTCDVPLVLPMYLRIREAFGPINLSVV